MYHHVGTRLQAPTPQWQAEDPRRIRLPPPHTVVSAGQRPMPSDPCFHSRQLPPIPVQDSGNARASRTEPGCEQASPHQNLFPSYNNFNAQELSSSGAVASSGSTSPRTPAAAMSPSFTPMPKGQSEHCKNEKVRRTKERSIRLMEEIIQRVFPSWDHNESGTTLTAANNRCGQMHKSLDTLKKSMMNDLVLLRVLSYVFTLGDGPAQGLIELFELWDPEHEIYELSRVNLLLLGTDSAEAAGMNHHFQYLRNMLWPESHDPEYQRLQQCILRKLHVIDEFLEQGQLASVPFAEARSRARKEMRGTLKAHRPNKRNKRVPPEGHLNLLQQQGEQHEQQFLMYSSRMRSGSQPSSLLSSDFSSSPRSTTRPEGLNIR